MSVGFFLPESFCSDQCSSTKQTGVVYEWLEHGSEHAWLLIMSCILALWGGIMFREQTLILMYDEVHHGLGFGD